MPNAPLHMPLLLYKMRMFFLDGRIQPKILVDLHGMMLITKINGAI